MNKSDLIRIINEEVNSALDNTKPTTINEMVDPIYDSNFPAIALGMITAGIAVAKIAKFLAYNKLSKDEIKNIIKDALNSKDGKLNENLKYPTHSLLSDRGYIGADIYLDSGKVALIIRSKKTNPYGGSPWSIILKDRGIELTEFTKEYIMSKIGESYKNPESFAGEVDEIISKVSSQYDDIIK